MAIPFRRTSKRTKRLRRTHFKLHVTGLVTCPHCGAMIKSHHVCPKCGYYDGKQVLVNGRFLTKKEEAKVDNQGKKSTKRKAKTTDETTKSK